MEIDVVTLSSKGQIVIPVEMREGFEQGEQILLIGRGDHIILKKASEIEDKFKEDIEFAEKTMEALKEMEAHPEEFKSIDAKDFLKLEKWSG